MVGVGVKVGVLVGVGVIVRVGVGVGVGVSVGNISGINAAELPFDAILRKATCLMRSGSTGSQGEIGS